MVVSAAMVGLILLALPAIRAARTAARRAQLRNDLKQIGLAFHNFHDTYRRLPPAVRSDELGRPLSSWRFQLLPFLEACMLDLDLDKAWDDPANRQLSHRGHPCYSLDYDRARVNCNANVVVITGPGTPFDGERICGLSDMDSDTILAIELADFDRHWMEPGDLPLDEVPPTITKGLDGEGVHVLFADAAVWYLRADVPLADLKKFFTIAGAKKYDREQVLGPYVVR